MRYAVVGSGTRASEHVRTAAELCEERLVDEVVVCDAADPARRDDRESRQRELARRHGLSYGPDPADLSVDAATLATAPAARYDLGRRLLANGVDLLVEPPIAESAANARDLVDGAAERGCTIAAGHALRHHPAIGELRRRIDRGELGSVEYLQASTASPRVPRTTADASRSLWVDAVDAFDYLLEVTSVDPRSTPNAVLADDSDDETTLVVDYGGATGVVNASWRPPASGSSRRLVVGGSERSALVRFRDDPALEVYEGDGGDPERVDVAGDDPLTAEVIDFLHAAETGHRPTAPGRVCADALALVERARASSGSADERFTDGTDRSSTTAPTERSSRGEPTERSSTAEPNEQSS